MVILKTEFKIGGGKMNRRLLKEIMLQRGFTAKRLAESIPIGKIVFWGRLWGISEFTLFEIQRISKIFQLDKKQIMLIFFDEKVS
ncbi:MAG: hypothetical protein IKB32_04120 [Clostridia bacterium]|nr:hypothetical protein [Clostridia bacterium]